MIVYRQKIVSEMDNREMVLVVAGKFIFGSNDGEKDEGPEQMLYLPDYYIDRWESRTGIIKISLCGQTARRRARGKTAYIVRAMPICRLL